MRGMKVDTLQISGNRPCLLDLPHRRVFRHLSEKVDPLSYLMNLHEGPCFFAICLRSGRNGMQTPLSRRYDLKPPVPSANSAYQAGGCGRSDEG